MARILSVVERAPEREPDRQADQPVAEHAEDERLREIQLYLGSRDVERRFANRTAAETILAGGEE